MQGKLIVMEGIDGCGKSTQYRLLRERLEREGRDVRSVKFPRYDNPSSALIRAYLAGEYGTQPGDVNPYAASAFYSVDRFASFRTDWGPYYRAGGIVLCDRYATSNACHQAGKLPAGKAREDYLDWLEDFEYRLLELPRPDLVLYLDAGLDIPRRQVLSRAASGGGERDIHETDAAYLAQCLEAGRFAAARLGWTRLDCLTPGGEMRAPEDIHGDIFRAVEGILL
ncbi:MAG: thymidylate kinase [Oscillospiraceae bacterium]|nr:thymidylate kinase [Oscillospiraceae bacterium]